MSKNFEYDFTKKTNLFNAKIGIRRDDGTTRKIDSLAGKVSSEPTLLALQTLDEPAGELLRGFVGRNPGQLTVEVKSTLQLQEVPVIL
jgi:hypothetical protein